MYHLRSDRHKRRTMDRARGFSLVEIAMVVAIALILLSLGLTAINSQLSSTAYSITKKRQDAITPIGNVENQKIERKQRGQATVSQPPQIKTSNEQHGCGNSGAGDSGT